MTPTHKNKTFATLLAATLGGSGIHRFYIHGRRDPWAWLHFASIPVSLILIFFGANGPMILLAGAFVASTLAAVLEALVIGLCPDEKWDARFNPDSRKKTVSGWPLALLLVVTVGGGAIGFIFVIARSFDLILTGGAYG
ncbi:NINE protein [soil metagenome]